MAEIVTEATGGANAWDSVSFTVDGDYYLATADADSVIQLYDINIVEE